MVEPASNCYEPDCCQWPAVPPCTEIEEEPNEGKATPALVPPPFFCPSFSFSFPTSSASTSFVSRRIGLRGFARFVVGSLFFPELLCFFKVDLLSCFDCT